MREKREDRNHRLPIRPVEIDTVNGTRRGLVRRRKLGGTRYVAYEVTRTLGTCQCDTRRALEDVFALVR